MIGGGGGGQMVCWPLPLKLLGGGGLAPLATPLPTPMTGTGAQRAYAVKMTSYKRRCDVNSSHRRGYDVILAPNAHRTVNSQTYGYVKLIPYLYWL